MTVASLLLALSPSSLASDWTPTAEQEATYRALSARDQGLDCERLQAEVAPADTVGSLRAVVEHATQPPWAPMRAAECMMALSPESAQDDMKRWVSEESLRGLGLLTLAKLDQLPEAVAVEVARAALGGHLAAETRERLTDTQHSAVKALLSP